MNPQADYHHVREVLRKDFRKRMGCEPCSGIIIFTTRAIPGAGRKHCCEPTIRCGANSRWQAAAGRGGCPLRYDRFLRRMIARQQFIGAWNIGRLRPSDGKAGRPCLAIVSTSRIARQSFEACSGPAVVASYVGGFPTGRSGRKGASVPR